MGKHAYLIMAHNNFEQLKKLLNCLDDVRNDIYIHIDAKVKYSFEDISGCIEYSKIYFTDRVKVNWGGYSQINAELILLKSATKNYRYDYYHLITGADLPLKSQEYIHNFFENNLGKDFVALEICDENHSFLDRVKYYWLFQDVFKRNSFIGKWFRRIFRKCQKILGIDRTKKSTCQFAMGSAYFDITDEFARFVVSKEEKIKKVFAHTFCADELFLQTMYMEYPYNKNKFVTPNNEHPYIQKRDFDILRAIDWKRGEPYTYRIDDFDMLINSGCLFARKFDIKTDEEIVNKIVDYTMNL